MTIQWFPGHMAKAKKEIAEKLKMVDVVIELLDARIPIASRNPMIEEIISNKSRMILLNKVDLADPVVVKEWIEFFSRSGIKAIPISSTQGKGINDMIKELELLDSARRDKDRSKGINPRTVRAMILGIPNVGKSALINRLANKAVAKTADKPGVTKSQQWIKVGKTVELLDTPGILWPKFEDQKVGYRLAATGAIKDQLLHFDDIALFLVEYMKNNYSQLLKARYKFDTLPEDNIELIELIGKKRGCLVSGGNIDFDKASELLIRELRQGKIGNYCLERPY